VNCSYCHQAGGTGIGAFDMRPELSLTQSTMIDAHVGNVQAGDHKAVVRGFNDKSVIWNRLSASGGYTRMPPLATAVIDPEGTQVVMDWINSMAAARPMKNGVSPSLVAPASMWPTSSSASKPSTKNSVAKAVAPSSASCRRRFDPGLGAGVASQRLPVRPCHSPIFPYLWPHEDHHRPPGRHFPQSQSIRC
jgi:hypothetical protein